MLRFATQRGRTRLVFGAGTSRELGKAVAELGFERVLVISTPGRESDAASIAKSLGERSVGVLSTAKEHVPREIAEQAARDVERARADAVLAVGGGSAIGLAKAVALQGNVSVLALPTTYSGSELTSIWGMTEGSNKSTGRDERVRAALVVYDPDLTLSLPLAVTVTSAWNAMAHAVEALWARAVDPATQLAAEESLRLFAHALPRVIEKLDDAEAREKLLSAAYLAATTIADTKMGVHHKICHVLGGLGMPHAKTHAALLPHVVRFNSDAAPDAMQRIARGLGVVDPVRGLFELSAATGVSASLAELGLARELIAKVAREVVASGVENPRSLDEASVVALLDGAWASSEPRAGEPEAARESSTLSGFGAALQSEALPGALPVGQNTPRRAPYGLYPELVSGTPFTVRRADNSRVWLYRIRPSTQHTKFRRLAPGHFTNSHAAVIADRARFRPMPLPESGSRLDFLDSLATLGGIGDPATGPGYAVHLWAANASMRDRCFSNADGDMLFVPQHGTFVCRTEAGVLRVEPGQILLVPRGIKHSVELDGSPSRGFLLEVFGSRLRLPERGPIGSNGLADPRHFQAPVAAWEDRACPGYEVITKLGGCLWSATQAYSPYDVVAWHGNHVPFRYDLSLFNAMGTMNFDHADPSINTVLTAPLDDHGRAVVDFVAFVGRWEVAEHSFRPPYFHRNAATEINAVIRSPAVEDGYCPGSCFVTPLLTGHGVSTRAYEEVIAAPDAEADAPHRIPDESLWVMFESALPFSLSRWALETELRDPGFAALFEGPKSHFDPGAK